MQTESLWATNEDGEEREIDIADETVDASPEKSLERNETNSAVREAIMKLTTEQREIVILRDINGFTYDEIAEMLGLEIGTVKSRLNRARGNLRLLLADVYTSSAGRSAAEILGRKK